ncbi:hypothetical protein FisN_12Hh283 [Fistulifera solaris]|uniref:Uncharacterized protein n=1 Tax=Fistulifera solaris TaxID=1519565 RepID=A0A1Z5KBX9_FISSO|nr:hypothetical protein FisN_12Hh283 [Fistulifera solaris]|eukprot:GAX23706.1 hypothetical protein FisN_12Hh283 [Fistulifera solaris]
MTLEDETTVRVIAPATLEEGYQFDVLVYGKPYTITVPVGGVYEGEEFEVPYDKDNIVTDGYDDEYTREGGTLPAHSSSQDVEEGEEHENGQKKDSLGDASIPRRDALGAPLGRWRYRVCACCDVLTQATFWMAFCCTPVLLAQLLTRLQLNWNGQAARSAAEASLTFNRIVLSFVAVLVFGQFTPGISPIIVFAYLFLLLVFVGSNLRKTMRKRYEIKTATNLKCCCFCMKEESFTVEDAVCMSVCGCCSLVQMARHTHDDKEYPGFCCTTTGLELDAPAVPILFKVQPQKKYSM